MLYLLMVVAVAGRNRAVEDRARTTPEQRREPDIVAFVSLAMTVALLGLLLLLRRLVGRKGSVARPARTAFYGLLTSFFRVGRHRYGLVTPTSRKACCQVTLR
jgi:hypothetical protein